MMSELIAMKRREVKSLWPSVARHYGIDREEPPEDPQEARAILRAVYDNMGHDVSRVRRHDVVRLLDALTALQKLMAAEPASSVVDASVRR